MSEENFGIEGEGKLNDSEKHLSCKISDLIPYHFVSFTISNNI